MQTTYSENNVLIDYFMSHLSRCDMPLMLLYTDRSAYRYFDFNIDPQPIL